MAKGLPAHNEDAIVKTNNFLAVVDGSTSKTKYKVQPDITNGQLAAILIRDYLQSVDSSAPHLSCKELCEGLTEHFQQEYLVRNVDIDALTIHPELRPTASVVVFSRCRQEVWLIGDCQCMINGLNTLCGQKVLDVLRVGSSLLLYGLLGSFQCGF